MVSRPGRITPVLPTEPTKVKVCLVGDAQVGKTAFCKGFKDEGFPTDYEATVGSDFYMKTIKVPKGQF